MFEHIKAAPADPILGLGEAFKSETRENKINLGIGVYKDAQGTTPIMRAVKEAEKRLFDNEKTKNYLSMVFLIITNAQKSSFSVKIQKLLKRIEQERYKV